MRHRSPAAARFVSASCCYVSLPVPFPPSIRLKRHTSWRQNFPPLHVKYEFSIALVLIADSIGYTTIVVLRVIPQDRRTLIRILSKNVVFVLSLSCLKQFGYKTTRVISFVLVLLQPNSLSIVLLDRFEFSSIKHVSQQRLPIMEVFMTKRADPLLHALMPLSKSSSSKLKSQVHRRC